MDDVAMIRAEVEALEAKWGIELMSVEQHESLMRDVVLRANRLLLDAGSTARLMP